MVDWSEVVRGLFTREAAFVVSVAILFVGLVLSYLLWRWVRSLLENAGIDEAVEGTPFERTAQGFGTSTIGLLAFISAVAFYIGTVVVALNVAQLLNPNVFWSHFTGYLPRLFIAAVAIIVGMLVGDKAKLYVSERLRSIKVPEVELIPEIVRYEVVPRAVSTAPRAVGEEHNSLGPRRDAQVCLHGFTVHRNVDQIPRVLLAHPSCHIRSTSILQSMPPASTAAPSAAQAPGPSPTPPRSRSRPPPASAVPPRCWSGRRRRTRRRHRKTVAASSGR